MLNFLRPAFARLFNPIVQGLARTPVTPNMITVAGTVGVSAAALSMFPIGELFPGAFTATVFVFTDMLDGQLARIKGNSGKYGAFLDSTMDRFGDAAVFGGITIWFMRTNHVLAVVSLFCLAGALCVSYVKARAEGLGLNANVGLIERPERLIIGLTSIGLSGLGIPYVLPIGMWGLAAGTALTLGQRMHAVYVDAKSQPAQAAAEQAASEQTASEQTTSEQTTSEQAASEQTASEQTASEQTTAAQAQAAGETAPPAAGRPGSTAAQPAPTVAQAAAPAAAPNEEE